MQCGVGLGPVEARPAPAPFKHSSIIPIAGVTAALLLVMLVGLYASGLLRATAAEPDSTLRVAANQPQPSLIKPAASQPGMPSVIREWLDHLRRIEERKNQLHARQAAQMKIFLTKYQALGGAAGLMGESGDPEDQANPSLPAMEQFDMLDEPWKDLIKEFEAVPPPPECQALADNYFRALSEIPGMIGDVQRLLQSLDEAAAGSTAAAQAVLEQAYSSQGSSYGNIDAYFANADEQLDQICERFNTPKWFDIKTDVGGGLLSRSGF